MRLSSFKKKESLYRGRPYITLPGSVRENVTFPISVPAPLPNVKGSLLEILEITTKLGFS